MATYLLWPEVLLCLEQTDCKTCGVDVCTWSSTFPCHCVYMTKLMNTSQSDPIYTLGCHRFTPRFYGLAVCL